MAAEAIEVLPPPDVVREWFKANRRNIHKVRDIARRVANAAVVYHRGDDLLMHVYLAGLYHGARLSDPQGKK